MPKIEIYSSAFCPFCIGARRLLEDKGIEFTLYSVDGDPGKRAEMMERGAGYTVPQVFIDDKPVGGYDELRALDRRDQLDPLLGLEPR